MEKTPLKISGFNKNNIYKKKSYDHRFTSSDARPDASARCSTINSRLKPIDSFLVKFIELFRGMGFDVSQKLSLDLHNGARDFQLLELTSDLHKPTSDFQLWEFDLWLQLGKLSESDINLKTPSLRSFLFILRRNN